jgi:hypothetical protein
MIYKALMSNTCPCVMGSSNSGPDGEGKPGAGMSCTVLAKIAKKGNHIKHMRIRTIIGTRTRPFVKVSAMVNQTAGEYWCNLVTGTLYNIHDGSCITSDLLRIVK